MKDLFIIGRLIAFIAFPIGLLFLLFNPFIAFLIIMGSIVIWNLCGHYLKKERSLEEQNTDMAETPTSVPGLNPINGKILFTKSPQRELEILNDSAHLIETTKNPDTFFNRYDLYMEKLSLLANAEITGKIKVTGDSLSAKLKIMDNQCQKINTINAFIDRMWDDTCNKANNLKTEKGKQNCYKKFYDILCKYEYRMPAVCIQHYKNFKYKTPTTISRQSISSSKIDEMQRVEASIDYRSNIYNKFYSDYSEKPYISQDREKNTNWINQASTFQNQSMVKKSMMQRFSDGLLPGHVYMLYWLDKYTNKRIPAYFEYKYGIDFEKERLFLIRNGYLENNKPTAKGHAAIQLHINVIMQH